MLKTRPGLEHDFFLLPCSQRRGLYGSLSGGTGWGGSCALCPAKAATGNKLATHPSRQKYPLPIHSHALLLEERMSSVAKTAITHALKRTVPRRDVKMAPPPSLPVLRGAAVRVARSPVGTI